MDGLSIISLEFYTSTFNNLLPIKLLESNNSLRKLVLFGSRFGTPLLQPNLVEAVLINEKSKLEEIVFAPNEPP